ncbi:MAG: VOC family protein [Alphaproteobacteria bacterium]
MSGVVIDHVSVGVADLARATAFYDPVLAALGLRRVMEVPGRPIGYGGERPFFWVGRPFDAGRAAGPGGGVHIALRAEDRAMVDAFYEAAMAHGGTDDGKPGLRPHYTPNYYAAFVLDPDGNKIEAVCRRPA